MESLIHPNDSWTIWAIILCSVALSIYLEQHFKWASKLTGPVIAIIIAIVLANTRILPLQSPSYTVIEKYFVPLAIPLLLFNANIFKIIKTSGSTFGAFHLSVLGTAIAGDCDCMVTGDKELQELKVVNDVPILSPAQFWKFEDQS